MKMVHPPSGLSKGLDFLIACDWTPEQALAVVELLYDLRSYFAALPVTDYGADA